jgi:hypothetical protein
MAAAPRQVREWARLLRRRDGTWARRWPRCQRKISCACRRSLSSAPALLPGGMPSQTAAESSLSRTRGVADLHITLRRSIATRDARVFGSPSQSQTSFLRSLGAVRDVG